MSASLLKDLRESVIDRTAFARLEDYCLLTEAYLNYLVETVPTKIVSPSQPEYFFFQYGQEENLRITRPLNSRLYVMDRTEFRVAFERLMAFLGDVKKYQKQITERRKQQEYIESNEVNRVVYTMQQSIGCISDSFAETNQARKRIGQLFETLVKLIIREVGLACEPRTVRIPIPGQPGYAMKYELDVVFSRNPVMVAAEAEAEVSLFDQNNIQPDSAMPAAQMEHITTQEVVGSVKTTSKDRIDKVFLDKYLLTKLLGRNVPVVAIFLHDVQRASAGCGDGRSIFGVASTFKTGHFLGYTVALNRLDGVYYVDPRPEMRSNPKLREQIKDFQQFLVHDVWMLSAE